MPVGVAGIAGRGLGWALAALCLAACSAIHWGPHVECEHIGEHEAPWPPAASGPILHLINWNLHGTPNRESMDDRLCKLARVVEARRPDLVLLQEVWFRGDADTLVRELDLTYQRIADASAITEHVLGWLIGFRKSGLLALRRRDSPWTVVEGSSSFQPFRKAAPKWRVWEMDGIATKGVQRFDVEHAETGVRVTMFNTHLQSPYRADEEPFGTPHPYNRVRRTQIKELGREARAATNLAVVAGDFNTTSEEKRLYAVLVQEFADLTSTFTPPRSGGTIVDETGRRQEWIDYVLTAPRDAPRVSVDRWRLVRNFKIDCPFSDHHGVEVRLRFDAVRH